MDEGRYPHHHNHGHAACWIVAVPMKQNGIELDAIYATVGCRVLCTSNVLLAFSMMRVVDGDIADVCAITRHNAGLWYRTCFAILHGRRYRGRVTGDRPQKWSGWDRCPPKFLLVMCIPGYYSALGLGLQTLRWINATAALYLMMERYL